MNTSEKSNTLNFKGIIILLSILLFSSKVMCDILLEKNQKSSSKGK